MQSGNPLTCCWGFAYGLRHFVLEPLQGKAGWVRSNAAIVHNGSAISTVGGYVFKEFRMDIFLEQK
jgi:hypothetical protein